MAKFCILGELDCANFGFLSGFHLKFPLNLKIKKFQIFRIS